MTWLQEILPQIGYGFICSFWQMALLFGLYKLTAAVYLPSPAERFRFAFLLSVMGSTWFLYTVFSGKPSAEWQVVASITQNMPDSFSVIFNQYMYWLGIVYLCLLAFSALKGHFQWKSTIRMMHSANGKAPVEWRLFTEKYAALLGIKKRVLLHISGTFSPATYGFLKPVILMPASCLTGLSTPQLQAILLHELAHIRRGDYLAAWVMQLAGILLYFNPFMRQLICEAKKECEHACDDLVMQFEYNPLQYAQALLAVAKSGQNRTWALQAQGSQQNLLLNRITRLLGQHDPQKSISWKNFGFPVLAIVLFFATTWVRHEPLQLPTINKTTEFTTVTPVQDPSKPWKQRVLEARVAILAAAAKQSAVVEKARQVNKMKVAEVEQQIAKNREVEEGNASLITPASWVLSADWADEQQAEAGLKEIEIAWKQFTVLLEKLELMGDLDEKEWEQIAALITLHAGIRETIYKETALSQNMVSYAASNAISAEPTGKILVIVHEEATGKLAASFMNPEEINAAYTDEFLPENRQQVMLLRKKAPAGKKIISL